MTQSRLKWCITDLLESKSTIMKLEGPGGGVLSIIAYTKGVPFSGFRYIKG